MKDDKVKDQKRKEVNFSKGRGIVYSIALAMAVCLLTGLAITFNVKRIEAKRTSIAIEAVQDLYQFSKVEDLDKNMAKLKDFTKVRESECLDFLK